ncbi:MAG: SMC-Scp complex subunit ScpB [Ignavibacteria bacterium]|jgi:segregation and condensation protein B|nr:SMC-Scp complex subunit ScpB [Ignavibacteria bacterium]
MKTNTPLFLSLDRTEQRAIIEALIFASTTDDNLSAENILKLALYNDATADNDTAEITIDDIVKLIEEINEDLDNSNRPYRIVHYSGCYQFATIPQYGEQVLRMYKSKINKNFSNAQLETLAIIAYKQPTTKQEIDRIRGVLSSSEVVNALIDKGLVQIAGRKDTLGRPLLYSTTTDFLRTFGLNALDDLPKLREIDEIAEEKLREDEESKTELVLEVSQEDIDKLGHSDLITIVADDDTENNEDDVQIEDGNNIENIL